MKLIIVESPTKAKTFSKFLGGKEYQVEATLGHIRDLPESKIAIDVEKNYKPSYVTSTKKKQAIAKIKELAKKADTIILATDSDREGEAISYHVAFILGYIKEDWPKSALIKNSPLKRIVFHEITKEAFAQALENPQEINFNLVDSQQARRILDRLVGYTLSPLLWKKIGKGWLSAGRVQTVALRFIVEREKEIEAFKSEPFFRVQGFFVDGEHPKDALDTKLVAKEGVKYEQKFKLPLFDGEYTYSKTTIDSSNKDPLHNDISKDAFTVSDIEENVTKRYPVAPFTTSTLQQEASRRFGYSAKITMRLAQNLYEKGFITYHRTDSVTLSAKFLTEATRFIEQKYGKGYMLEKPRVFTTKSKLAQEAHEAIRPTSLEGVLNVEDAGLTPSHSKLYDLITAKALASQMKEAEIKTVKIKINGKKGYEFETGFEQIMFDGFLKAYPQKEEKQLLSFIPKKGSDLKLDNLKFTEQFTQAPPRYNEASLIKTLEEAGIGRPSTYAPTISTIQDRNYVEKKEGRFYPTFLGKTVCDYLSSAFADFFAINFTAQMEDGLDHIAHGKENIIHFLDNYYKPFDSILQKEKASKTHIDVQEETGEICPECGKSLVFRYSKFGKFYACSGYPKCKFTKPFFEKIQTPCPKCGGDIIVKYTRRKKKFYGCSNYPKCDFAAWRLNQIPKEGTMSQTTPEKV